MRHFTPTTEIPCAVEFYYLEKGDKKRHLNNPNDFWDETKDTVPLSDLTEEQAEKIVKYSSLSIEHFRKVGWISVIYSSINITLKQAGIPELRDWNEPVIVKEDHLTPQQQEKKYRARKQSWDNTTPLSSILIVMKP